VTIKRGFVVTRKKGFGGTEKGVRGDRKGENGMTDRKAHILNLGNRIRTYS
jgi:hypothetical protein